jgi:DNA-binding NtrC family response regulator
MQILLIDDEPIELFISKKFLAMAFTVEGFNAMPDAVAWAQTNSFDVLVSDYNLGGSVHAHDVLKALKAVKGETFKAYVLTNHVDSDQADAILKAGFQGIIEKPLSLEKFKAATGL